MPQPLSGVGRREVGGQRGPAAHLGTANSQHVSRGTDSAAVREWWRKPTGAAPGPWGSLIRASEEAQDIISMQQTALESPLPLCRHLEYAPEITSLQIICKLTDAIVLKHLDKSHKEINQQAGY